MHNTKRLSFAIIAFLVTVAIVTQLEWDKLEATAFSKTHPKSIHRDEQLSGAGQSNSAESDRIKQKPKEQHPLSKESDAKLSALLQEKRQQAMSLLSGVIVGLGGISPNEYRILCQVEAAIQSWDSNQALALEMLRGAIKAAQEPANEERKKAASNPSTPRTARKVYFFALRKIAEFKPELVKNVLNEEASANKEKTGQSVPDKWSDEARVLVSVATDQIATNPAAAARAAEESLSHGLPDLVGFLKKLSQRDSKEAERLAYTVISRLRDSNVTPVYLRNIGNFVFSPRNSIELQEYLIQSLATNLRRDIRPDVARNRLIGNLFVAREMERMTNGVSPHLHPEFIKLISDIESEFRRRSFQIPGSLDRKVMEAPKPPQVEPSDTKEIREAVFKTETIQGGNKEYQKLAVRAALAADRSLAEEIIDKINNKEIRRETTLLVYEPLTRKAIKENNWIKAQEFAIEIEEPLGRTLVFDRIAKEMLNARQGKSFVRDVYQLAWRQLEIDEQSSQTGRSYLVILKSMLSLDQEDNWGLINSTIVSLNKLTDSGDLFKDPSLYPAVLSLVENPEKSMWSEELLYFADMFADVFGKIAKRDKEKALSLAAGFSHLGLRSLAQLTVSKEILTEMKKLSAAPQHKR